uniref:Uncharacterized protein n=1 Tax=Anguilla anguilla TaxID=7936 RepID=A0A0E9V815_ANGAN
MERYLKRSSYFPDIYCVQYFSCILLTVGRHLPT